MVPFVGGGWETEQNQNPKSNQYHKCHTIALNHKFIVITKMILRFVYYSLFDSCTSF